MKYIQTKDSGDRFWLISFVYADGDGNGFSHQEVATSNGESALKQGSAKELSSQIKKFHKYESVAILNIIELEG
jgi:hypothetical protein